VNQVNTTYQLQTKEEYIISLQDEAGHEIESIDAGFDWEAAKAHRKPFAPLRHSYPV
jgi:hypothetical protein